MADYPRTVDSLTRSEMEDGLSIHHPESDRVHFLNHTGAVIFELCNGRHSIDEIIQLVQTAFDLEEPPENEVRSLLANAVEAGLIEWTKGHRGARNR
jgi:hypothetical protein